MPLRRDRQLIPPAKEGSRTKVVRRAQALLARLANVRPECNRHLLRGVNFAMATQGVTDWKKEWFEIEDATYLNTAAHTVMPRVSIRAVEHALEAKKFPHRVDESVWFEAAVRIRKSLSKMIGAKSEEIAVTTGASAGAAVVAYGLEWKRGDEIITV